MVSKSDWALKKKKTGVEIFVCDPLITVYVALDSCIIMKKPVSRNKEARISIY